MPDEVKPDKAYNLIKRKMQVYVRKWSGLLGLQQWTIHVNWNWSNKKDIDSGHIVGGETYTSWPYLRAHIEFFLPDLSAYAEDDLEEVVVHEMTHILTTQGFQNEGSCTPDQERVVTELAKAFLRVDRAE